MHAFRLRAFLTLFLPLALAIGSVVHARTGPVSAIRVTNCNDAGPGSLRAAVAGAASGDVISLRSLRCRRLVLTSGAIRVIQDNLTLLGPPRAFTIDGNHASRVFEHSGTGTLRLRTMSIANGHLEGLNASGGCIDSQGNLRLEYVRVHGCDLVLERGRFTRGGGGGMAANDVALYNSHVFDNTVQHPTDSVGPAGGIWARGHLTLVRSRVNNNVASGRGGGFYAEGGLHARYSEISGNHANDEGGFFAGGGDLSVVHSLIANNSSYGWMNAGLSGTTILIADTTVSGNTTAGNFSALVLSAEETSIVNSTIVDNVEETRSTGRDCGGAVSFFGQLHLESTIIARNLCDGQPLDIVGGPAIAIVGSDNLVQVSTMPLPSDTISADPRISPLADNGGRTRTHRLWRSSPAVDMGNNAAGLRFDQRGPGFPRVKGGRADIGAYER